VMMGPAGSFSGSMQLIVHCRHSQKFRGQLHQPVS
jgi:hypothetical protein